MLTFGLFVCFFIVSFGTTLLSPINLLFHSQYIRKGGNYCISAYFHFNFKLWGPHNLFFSFQSPQTPSSSLFGAHLNAKNQARGPFQAKSPSEKPLYSISGFSNIIFAYLRSPQFIFILLSTLFSTLQGPHRPLFPLEVPEIFFPKNPQ